MKKIAMTTAALVISATGAFAEEADIIVNKNYDWPNRTEDGDRYHNLDRINIFTLRGQNTNGEDLRCVQSLYGYGGGLSCNWSEPKPQ